MVLEILLESLSVWLFQFKCSFMVKPRQLKSLTWSIAIFSMFNYNWFILFWGIWKIIYLHLDIFRESLLHFNHSFIHAISELILDSTLPLFMLFRMTSIVVERVVSSAYIIKLNKLLALAISLTYMIKRRGPYITACSFEVTCWGHEAYFNVEHITAYSFNVTCWGHEACFNVEHITACSFMVTCWGYEACFNVEHITACSVMHSEKSPARPMLFYSTNYWQQFWV